MKDPYPLVFMDSLNHQESERLIPFLTTSCMSIHSCLSKCTTKVVVRSSDILGEESADGGVPLVAVPVERANFAA